MIMENTHVAGLDKLPVYWLAFGDSSLTFDDLEMEWLLSLSANDVKTHSFSIYPNPASSLIHIQPLVSFGTVGQVNVYDITSRLMLTAESTSVDISGLSNGLYIVEVVNSKGQKAVTKISKQG